MLKTILLITLVSLIASCGKSDSTAPVAATGTIASGVDIAGALGNILPSPGTDGSRNRNARNSSRDVAAWTQNPSYALEPWMGFQLFRLLADPTIYDPASSVWGVQNVRNSVNLGGFIAEKAQVLSTGSLNVSMGAASFPVVTTAIQDLTSLFFMTPSYPITYFTDDPGGTFEHGRLITVDGTLTVAVGWGTASDVFYLKTAERDASRPETSFMEGQYNETTGDLRINRACYANNSFLARLNAAGNESNGTFTVKFINYSTSGSGSIMSVVAKGSNATGGHYIVKMVYDDDTTVAGGTTRYFCVDADATEDEFTAFMTANFVVGGGAQTHADYTGAGVQMVASTANFTGDCNGSAYIAQVNAITMYSEADLPSTGNLWDDTAADLDFQ